MYSLSGSQLLKNGVPVRVRGVSLGNWLLLESYMLGFPYVDCGIQRAFADVLGERGRKFWDTYRAHTITEADFAAIAALGFNAVRLPFTYRLLESGQQPGRYSESGFRWIDLAMGWARKHGLGVILDLHAAPGSQADDWNADNVTGQKLLWENADYRRRTVALWSAIAARYRDEPAVLAYDVLCEPVAPDVAVLNALYKDIIAAIRAAGSRQIIQLEPNRWARDWASLDKGLFADDQVMAQAHVYPSLNLPPDVVAAYPHGQHNGQAIDAAYVGRVIEAAFDPGLERPRFMGEFGIDTVHPHHAWLGGMIDYLEATGTHWCLWAWKDIGRFGIMRPKAGTAFPKLVNSEPMQERRDYIERTCGVSFGDYLEGNGRLVNECGELFAGVDVDTIHRAVREAKRNLEKLHLLWMVTTLRAWNDAELEELARGFALEQCEPDAAYVAVLGRVRGVVE